LFPTLAAALDCGRSVPGAAAFVDRMEAEVTARLAAAPERMLIPLGKMLLVREGGWADSSVESRYRSQLSKDL
jgi:hypothetical protein